MPVSFEDIDAHSEFAKFSIFMSVESINRLAKKILNGDRSPIWAEVLRACRGSRFSIRRACQHGAGDQHGDTCQNYGKWRFHRQ